jgi:hypothetical protein
MAVTLQGTVHEPLTAPPLQGPGPAKVTSCAPAYIKVNRHIQTIAKRFFMRVSDYRL